jgi:membrane protease YdiL (CAAX protease family)
VSLLAFFVLTFALTWAAWFVPGTSVGGPVFLLGVFAPAIVALGLTAFAEGRNGVAQLLARIAKWQVAGRYYVFAVAYMAAVKVTAAVIHRLVLGVWPALGDGQLIAMLAAIPVSTVVQAGEEVGWRGYALPRLAARLGLGGAGALVGILWALWHLPLFFRPDGGTEGQSFGLYIAFVTAISVAMAWLYTRTEGSLLLPMLMHASINNTTFIPLAAPRAVTPISFDGSAIAWISVGVAWTVAAVLLWLSRTRGSPARPDAGAGARVSGA